MSSGPSQHDINGTHVNHYIDGFGRFCSFKIGEGEKGVSFSSKMLNSNYYTHSKRDGCVIPGLLFQETTPPRWRAQVPMVNLLYQRDCNDNNWVDLELTADGKDFVITSDSEQKLLFDINTLEQKGPISWEDNLNLMSGVSHSQTLPDGTVLSLGQDVSHNIILFKIEPENPRKRIQVAKIPHKEFVLAHSFGLTKDYAIVMEPPFYLDISALTLMFQNVSISERIKAHEGATTKIHVIRLSDGHIQTLDTNIFTMVLHFGNAWQSDDNTIVIEGTSFENKESSPFDTLHMKNLTSKEGIVNEMGCIFKRFTLKLDENKVEMDDLIQLQYGSAEFPTFNPDLQGKSENRYSYLLEMMSKSEVNHEYKWPLIKYDHENKQI